MVGGRQGAVHEELKWQREEGGSNAANISGPRGHGHWPGKVFKLQVIDNLLRYT